MRSLVYIVIGLMAVRNKWQRTRARLRLRILQKRASSSSTYMRKRTFSQSGKRPLPPVSANRSGNLRAVVADDIASGALIKAFDLSLPGYGYYPVYASNHPRRATIDVFVQWISTAARREMVPRAGRSSIRIGKE